jgi:hypothetical protein
MLQHCYNPAAEQRAVVFAIAVVFLTTQLDCASLHKRPGFMMLK